MTTTNQQNFMNWDNPGIALITGASSGIGAEFARQLAKQGFDLILVARRKEKLEVLKEDLERKNSIKAEIIIADLSVLSENQKIIDKISKLTNIDVLINNAGFGYTESFLEANCKLNIEMIMVHLTSPVIFCQVVLPNMLRQKRGVIINVSSMSVFLKAGIIYTTTKNAVTMFSELLKNSIKGKGIFIQALCPGFTHTEFHDSPTMVGFNKSLTSKNLWMNVEDVVSLSLESIKSNQVIFIPGELNKKIAAEIRKANLNRYLKCKII